MGPAVRRGEYGLDGSWATSGLSLQVGLELAAIAGVVAALRRRRADLAAVIGFMAAALGGMTASYLYSTQRGKFEVWSELLDELGLHGDERLLDVGCGRGAVLLLGAERVRAGRAVGVDLWRARDQSGNSRAAVERNAVLEGVADRVELVHGDARELPFEDGSFDVVVSNLTVHNIPARDGRTQALREIVRVLRPGGRLRIVDFRGAGYLDELRAAGCVDVERRALGWRMWFSNPATGIVLVSAARAT